MNRLYHAQITAATATASDINGQIVALGTPVTVSGSAYYADGLTPAAGVAVSVRQLAAGQRKIMLATTDANGRFSFTFKLADCGDTILAADHVDVPADTAPDTAQVSFSVAGIGVTTIGGVQSLTPGGGPLNGQIILTSASSTTLTGLTFTPQNVAPNIQFQFIAPLPTSLDASAVTVQYTVSATDDSYTYDNIVVHIASDQGATADVPIGLSIVNLRPALSMSPGYLSGDMIVGQHSQASFAITNYGFSATGPMTVQLPSSSQAPFLSVVGGTSIATLAPGASTTVILALDPAAALTLTNWSGNVVVGNANVSVSEGYSFRARSTALGQVQVTVEDDLTLYSSSHPNLVGASVELLDALNTSTVIASGISDASGTVTFSGIAAGNYVVAVSADNHEGAHQSIVVAVNQTTNVSVFAAKNLVSYSWIVTQTAIQDQYTITLQATFDTQVPVGLDFSAGAIPQLLPGGTGELDLTLHNISLIALKNVEIVLPTDPEYTFSITAAGWQAGSGDANVYPLPQRTGTDPDTGNPVPVPAGELLARETLVVPVQVQRGYTFFDSPCHTLFQAPWSYQPNDNLNEFVAHTAVAVGDFPGRTCTPQGIPQTYGGGGGGGGGGTIAGGGPISIPVLVDVADAKVRLQISQSAVLTRNAFDGVLDITNHGSAPLNNVHVNLTFSDMQGNNASAAFFYQSPTLSGFSGGGDIDATTGPGPDLAGSNGTVEYLFIPTRSAAPATPTVYNIGGSFSYDDAQGDRVTMPVFPATITVYPDAHFVLNYFWQRDVAGDNPFTADVTEPSEPATIGLIATNVGAGDAQNFSITSAQPQIIDNQKGLLVGVTLTGTQVGANPVTATLTANLGAVAAGASQTVEWSLLSSLQGHFSGFSASYQHGDALGGLDTSLIDAVFPHDLIHAAMVNGAGNDGKPDFLVASESGFANAGLQVYYGIDPNGPTDPGTGLPTPVPVYSDQPNALFDSRSGLGTPVADIAAAQVATGPVSIDPATQQLSVTVTTTVGSGWNYLEINDPAMSYPQYALASVTRSDGEVIGVGVNANAWQTDRVFDNYGFLNKHLLHLLDQSAGTQSFSYTLVYAPTVAVTGLTGVEAFPALIALPHDTLKVFFSGPINQHSFDPSNVLLQYRAAPTDPWTSLSTTGLTLGQFVGNNLQYTMSGLAALTSQAGYYQLTFNGSAVRDAGGNAVTASQTVPWQLSATAIPTNVVVTWGNAYYDQAISLMATVSSTEPAAGTPSGGTVQFQIDGADVGAADVRIDGTAHTYVPGMNVGSHTITAIYSGNSAGFAGSSVSSVLQVSPAPIAFGLQPNKVWLLDGQELSVIAIASGTPLAPDGVVTFYDNGTMIASHALAIVNGQDQAVLDTSLLAPGRRLITVSFRSDSGNFAMTSASPILTIVVFPADATVLTVVNTSSDPMVAGGLPWAVAQADANNVATVITFATGSGQVFADPQSITLETPLDILGPNSIAIEGPSWGVTLVGDYSHSRFPILNVEQNANILMQGMNIGTPSPGANGDLAVAGVLDVLVSVANLGSAVSVTGGGMIDLGGQTVTADSVTLTDGSVSNGTLSTGMRTVFSGALGANLTGSDGLIKNGAGVVVLSGDNTYTGGTTVSSGTLVVTSAGALLDASSLTVGSATMFAPPAIATPSDSPASRAIIATAEVPEARKSDATASSASALSSTAPISASASVGSVSPARELPSDAAVVAKSAKVPAGIQSVRNQAIQAALLPQHRRTPAWSAEIVNALGSASQDQRKTASIAALDMLMAEYAQQ